MPAPVVEGSASNETASGTTHDITYPASMASGEIVVAALMIDANSASQSFTDPTSYVQREESLEQFARQFSVWTYPAAGGETTETFTVGVAGTGIGGMVRISGHDGYDVSAKSTSPGFDSSEDSPSVTTTVNDCLVIIGHIRSGNAVATLTPPGSTTALFDTSHSTSSTRLTLRYFTQATAGATGAKTWSWDGDGWNQAFTIAIKPAAAASGRRSLTLLGVS